MPTGICEGVGQACIVDVMYSLCVTHDQTECACDGVGDQCDPYNNLYIEHCVASGPYLVEPCPEAGTCYNGVCFGELPECTPDSWNLLKPECTNAVYCDADGSIIAEVSCEDGEYLNSELNCSPAPPPACDGSCTGRCPNPVDCSKFFVCDGSTAVVSGDCPEGTLFDIVIGYCSSTVVTCTPTNGCAITPPILTSTPMTTAGAVTSTTTKPYPGYICDESTLGTQYPTVACSKICLECITTGPGIFELVVRQCADCS